MVRTTAGYSGGHTEDPTYEDICTHTTGHAEVVLVEFDPTEVSYQTLVRHFFRMHDPTLRNGDGINVGDNYRSALYYYDEDQQRTSEAVMQEIQAGYDKPLATEFAPAGPFYEAEAYHQKFTERTGRGVCHVAYEPIG